MFIQQFDSYPISGTYPVSLICGNCGNETEHLIHAVPHGIQMGIAFSRKPLLGAKKFYLVCPICGNLTKELTKEQVKSNKRQLC